MLGYLITIGIGYVVGAVTVVFWPKIKQLLSFGKSKADEAIDDITTEEK